MKDSNYDLVAALHNKLEAVTVYDRYMKDCTGEKECSTIWQQMKQDDLRHAEMLRKEIERHAREGEFG
jgi:hypothetical protein